MNFDKKIILSVTTVILLAIAVAGFFNSSQTTSPIQLSNIDKPYSPYPITAITTIKPTSTPASAPNPISTPYKPIILPAITPSDSTAVYHPSECAGSKISKDKFICINNKPVFILDMMALCDPAVDGVQSCSESVRLTPEFSSTSETILWASHSSYVDIFEKAGKYYSVNSELASYIPRRPYLLWYEIIPNEPGGNQAAINTAIAKYKAFKSSHPNELMFAANWAYLASGMTGTVNQYADVMGFDIFEHKSDYSNINEFIFHEEQTYVNNLIKNGINVNSVDDMPIPIMGYIMSSGQQWGEGSRNWIVYPKTHLRAEAYFQIVAGTKGIMFWPYKNSQVAGAGLISNPVQVQIYKDVIGEIASPEIQKIITQKATHYSWVKETSWDNFVTFSNNPTVLSRNSLAYRYYPSQHLIIVNKGNNKITTDISIQGFNTGKATTLGRPISGATPGQVYTISNGKFTDTFQPFEVKIYEIKI